MNKELYQFYSIEDFLQDNNFIRYVKSRAEADVSFWELWISGKPGNIDAYNEAYAQLLMIFSHQEIPVPHGFQAALWIDINKSIDTIENKRRKSTTYLLWSSSIAASIIAGIFSVWYFTGNIVVHTDYGQTKNLKLTDGTEVILNANSTLSYPRAYAWKKIRSMSLEGEAYFKVNHLNQDTHNIKRGEAFEAVTGSVEVSVLGTEFNLKQRHGIALVGLINGRVLVKSIKTGKKYVMQPGNVIKVNSADGKIIVNPQGSSTQSAWVDGKLVINQTSVKEIITAFEDLYGYKIILDNPALGNKKIDGSISIKSEQNLLFTLSSILNVDIKREGKVIRLQTRP
ncbi:DUF4974 domain-containing protein [Pedobacter petrophilus]|uniref:DUF4974 domain-containing protein n=1 Tax=Pedobacter petrophilus TaxID=1908241 RepID=A0A7K0G2S2_9SPHI|nr:FecR family protein [Pedobacter petrophilus]MRX78117.1 DUF4974 domain-containing protein [Pedobacter petrophilus]